MAQWVVFAACFGVPAALTGSLLLMLANERADSGDYGFPLFQNLRMWRPEQYTERGQRLLPWLYVAVGLQTAGAIILISVL
jgi:hypothetical protein